MVNVVVALVSLANITPPLATVHLSNSFPLGATSAVMVIVAPFI